MNPSRNTLIAIVGVTAVLLAGLIPFITNNNVTNAGNKKEASLSAVYNDGAVKLSNCVVKTNQIANVAGENAKRFDKVIEDAVAGNGAFKGVTGSAGFVPILTQTYPDLKGQTDLYRRVADTIAGCQDDFRSAQSTVQDQVRSFNSWRTGSWTSRTFGGEFPNDNLSVNIPGVPVLHGQAALDKISQPIVDGVTSSTYQSGQQNIQGPFGDS
jgi:hypothetical protein